MCTKLLQDIAEHFGCEYISDIKFLPEPDAVKIFLKYISPETYSKDDWNQAASYLTRNKAVFVSAEEARKYILDTKLPRLL